MKLLVVSHACITPLNQSFYADVAKATNWDVSLVVPSTWKNEYRSTTAVDRWPAFTGQIYRIPVWKPGNVPLHMYRRTMWGLLRSAQPDAIYMHHEPYGLATAQLYAANRLAGNKPIGFYAAQNITKQYPIPFRWLERAVLRHSQFCFPVTSGALDVLRGKGYTGLAEVLPLPVDRELYFPDREKAKSWRALLGIPEQTPVIGYLGRLVEEKGLRNLLLALKQIEDLPWRCVLAGSGPFEQPLHQLCAELGLQDRVIFPGFVPHQEAPGLLSLFDVLVLASETRPNWKEQFGRVLIEANACGAAVVGTDSGEIAHVIRSTGGGLIVPERDVTALSEALRDLLESPEKRALLAARGAEAVATRYDQVHLVSRFAATIKQACGTRAGRR